MNQQTPDQMIDDLLKSERNFMNATVRFVCLHLNRVLWALLAAIVVVATLTLVDPSHIEGVADGIARMMELLAIGTVATAAVLTMVLVVVTAGPELLRAWWRQDAGPPVIAWISVWFGRALLLALDLLIGADIVASVGTPRAAPQSEQWQELGQLASVVAIRVVLGLVLRSQTEAISRAQHATRQPASTEARVAQAKADLFDKREIALVESGAWVLAPDAQSPNHPAAAYNRDNHQTADGVPMKVRR